MPKTPRVTLLKQVKIDNKWRHARVRRDRVRISGQEELHPEGSYFIEWWDEGKRHLEPVGADAQTAAEKARVKQAELVAVRGGIVPQPQVVEVNLERLTLAQALDSYNTFNITARFGHFGPIVRSSMPSKASARKPTWTR
jgi:integrase/recombinase XerD